MPTFGIAAQIGATAKDDYTPMSATLVVVLVSGGARHECYKEELLARAPQQADLSRSGPDLVGRCELDSLFSLRYRI